MDPQQLEAYLTYYCSRFLYITGTKHVEAKNNSCQDTDRSQAMDG
jgi:hypothetical protein